MAQQSLGCPALAENQNFPMAPKAQENTNVGESSEKRIRRPFSLPHVWNGRGNHESPLQHM